MDWKGIGMIYYESWFFQREDAAFLAIAFRLAGLSFLARA
jgi:hypothetical protein